MKQSKRSLAFIILTPFVFCFSMFGMDRCCEVPESKATVALYVASIVNNIKEAHDAILDDDVELDWQFRYGMTALHRAARNGFFEIVMLLIEKGADIEARDDSCSTPLHHAAAAGHTNVVKLLIQHNANIDARDDSKFTAMDLALKRGFVRVARVFMPYRRQRQKRGDIANKAYGAE